MNDVSGKGDLFEAILSSEKKTLQRNLPEHFSDYPEQVYSTLVLFYKIWELQPLAVPNRRQKAKFAMWITELQELSDVCGTEKRTSYALTEAYKRYMSLEKEQRFIVWKPSLIRNLVIHELTELDRENKPKEPQVTLNKKEVNDFMERMKNI